MKPIAAQRSNLQTARTALHLVGRRVPIRATRALPGHAEVLRMGNHYAGAARQVLLQASTDFGTGSTLCVSVMRAPDAPASGSVDGTILNRRESGPGNPLLLRASPYQLTNGTSTTSAGGALGGGPG